MTAPTATACGHPCLWCAMDNLGAPHAPPAPPAADEPDGLLTVAEAAEVLACSEQHIRRLIRRGELTAPEFAGGRKVRRSTLRAFMDDLEREAS